MNREETGAICLLIIIISKKQEGKLLNALLDAEVCLINTTYAEGTVKAGILQNVLGFVPEKHKTAFICMVTHEKSHAILSMLVDKFCFDQSNTGIAFTIPIEQLSF